MFNKKLLQNNKIKMIVNVYRQNYANAPGGGIGDFIRGSFFLLQFCIKNNLRFEVDYNSHPITKYLYKRYNKIEDNINYDKVLYYYPDNKINSQDFFDNFVNYLNSIDDEIVYIYSNNYPLFKINIFEKNFLKEKILPTNELNQIIQNKKHVMGLTYNNYIVIHIRLSDDIFKHDNVSDSMLPLFYNFVNNIIRKTKYKILILSNSNNIKKKLKIRYNNIIIDINNISHMADTEDYNSIKDTLCDMFLLTSAKHVYAISSYGHGTGFSKYICCLYDIPYDCLILK